MEGPRVKKNSSIARSFIFDKSGIGELCRKSNTENVDENQFASKLICLSSSGLKEMTRSIDLSL